MREDHSQGKRRCTRCGEEIDDTFFHVCPAATLTPEPAFSSLSRKFEGATTHFRLSEHKQKWDCAICGKSVFGHPLLALSPLALSSSFESLLSNPHNFLLDQAVQSKDAATSGRERVKWEIMRRIYSTGSFGFDGLVPFWKMFEGELCSACGKSLKELAEANTKAKRLLEVAHELDPNNDVVKKNLAALG
jgi:hypothetical protein